MLASIQDEDVTNVKLKAGIMAAAVLFICAFPAGAKEKGLPVTLNNWGVLSLPRNMYIKEGFQPVLTAQAYKNDAAAMLERIYPSRPETYQVVVRDGASFQYGYLLRYSTNVWEIEAAVDRQLGKQEYLNSAGVQPDMSVLMEQAENVMKENLPDGFRLRGDVTASKKKGRVFYECTLERNLVVNQRNFTELMRCIAWQHGNQVEIAVILSTDNGWDSNLADVLAQALKTANKMAKK